MPRKCSAVGCKSNYDTEQGYTTVFYFPTDEDRREKWIRQLHRDNFTPNKTSVVCIKHFDEKFIIRESRAVRPDGTELLVPRVRPTLTANAYPTIFENLPAYLSSTPCERPGPASRAARLSARDEQNFANFFEKDIIKDIESFKTGMLSKLLPKWLVLSDDKDVFIAKACIEDIPKLIVSIKISPNLVVTVWHEGMLIHASALKWLLGSDMKCTRWSTFESLISHLNGYTHDVPTDRKLNAAVNLIKECSEDLSDGCMQKRLIFLCEQINLLIVGRCRYSSHTMMWACIFFFSHPSAYRSVRNADMLTLPHPKHLKKLLQSLGTLHSGISPNLVHFLKGKNAELSDREKTVTLMMDEIYVKPGLFYKGGTVEGLAVNNSAREATTVQAFMISSVFSKNRDIVGLFPVLNESANDLYDLLLMVLKMLHETGYNVLCIVADNNRINRKTYERLCGGELKIHIENPVVPNQDLFLLFDTVHLMKSIRNNWLNKSETNQTFFIPPLPSLLPSEIFTDLSKQYLYASVKHLKFLHQKEEKNVIKLAPSLSRKSLYPSNLERQNVGLALKLFDEKLVPALDTVMDTCGHDIEGTKHFINIISKWWKIVNVNTPYKGEHLREPFCEPIIAIVNDMRLEYLKAFCIWLEEWENLEVSTYQGKSRDYKLSTETNCALLHTTKVLIAISEHLLIHFNPPVEYVLLARFQSDHIESRFGQYRGMCGGNYHLTVSQILESERKLKVIGLMHLKSAKLGSFEVRQFFNSCEEPANLEVCCNLNRFENVLSLADGIEITECNKKVLIYLAGYVARVATKSCTECKKSLSLEKELEYETSSSTVHSYLSILNRGGLFWPSDLTVEIICCVFCIFQTLITEEFEVEFLESAYQRRLLQLLAEEKLEESGISVKGACPLCKRSKLDLVRVCLKVMSNILLNNYCKLQTEKFQQSSKNKKQKKRKLATLK